MSNIQYRLLGGEQVIPLLGDEQTTRSRVVMTVSYTHLDVYKRQVESRRGGGGHITIKKIHITQSNYLMHIITSIEDTLTSKEVDIFISNLLSDEIVTKKEDVYKRQQ